MEKEPVSGVEGACIVGVPFEVMDLGIMFSFPISCSW